MDERGRSECERKPVHKVCFRRTDIGQRLLVGSATKVRPKLTWSRKKFPLVDFQEVTERFSFLLETTCRLEDALDVRRATSCRGAPDEGPRRSSLRLGFRKPAAHHLVGPNLPSLARALDNIKTFWSKSKFCPTLRLSET